MTKQREFIRAPSSEAYHSYDIKTLLRYVHDDQTSMGKGHDCGREICAQHLTALRFHTLTLLKRVDSAVLSDPSTGALAIEKRFLAAIGQLFEDFVDVAYALGVTPEYCIQLQLEKRHGKKAFHRFPSSSTPERPARS